MLNGRHVDGSKTVLVAGGAGFVGSHLCDALLADGHEVMCVDSFLTGSPRNVLPLKSNPRFRLIRHDICEKLSINQKIDQIYNLACPASPIDWFEQTLKQRPSKSPNRQPANDLPDGLTLGA
jgi:UDP-glucuronate decarboxylase